MNVFLMKIRFLSQTDETSCILDQQNGKVKENQGNSPNEIVKLNNEIQVFMNDTYNEVNFYLENQEINNSTEKCEKSSKYIYWKGMDYVNLILNKEKNYNISNLVDCWNDKQESFKTHILKETNSTCNFRTFDYCALLNKNNKCSSPYENNNLLKSTSLTYEQLKDDNYDNNKTYIIDIRRSQFYNITYDMFNYYFKMYENDRSELNCGKWSMYVYKRGKQFVNMMTNEINSDEPYVQNYVNVWNSFSQSLEQYTLDETQNQCNMTALLHKINERENSDNPYDLSWIKLDKNQKKKNETLGLRTSLPYNIQSTNRTTNVSDDAAAMNSIDNSTSNNKIAINTHINTTLEPLIVEDQTMHETITTISSDVTTQPNFLTSGSTPRYDLHTTEPSASTSSISGDTSSASSNTYSSKDSSKHTISVEPPTSSTTFLTTEYQLSPSVNIVEPNENDSTSPPDDKTTLPTITVHPLTNNTTPFKTNITTTTNGSSSSPKTEFPFTTMSSMDPNSSSSNISTTPITKPTLNSAVVSTNNSMSTAKDNTIHPTISSKSSTYINRFSSMSDSNSNRTLSTSLESIIFNTTNNVTKSPITNSGISSLGINNTITQNPQNTSNSFILAKQILPLNNTQNSTLGNNASANHSNFIVPKNTIKPTKSDNPINDTPEITPTGNVLITIVPVGIFILGIIFLLILLCKYTFIGSWFRKRKSKKKKIRKKMKEISKEPLLMSLNDMESEPIYSGKYSLLNHEKQMPLCEIILESERNLKYRQMKKSKECGDKRVCEVVEEVSKYKNELPIKEEKLNEDDSKNEIEEGELNKNKSRSKIRKEKLIKSGLKKNAVHIVGYIRENTLNEEETNEINVKSEKSTYENEMKNSENKTSFMDEACNWNTWANIHIIALLECKKEEWELIKNEFLRICIEEFEKDEETTYLKELGNNLVKKGEEESSTVVTEKNSSIPEKWKKEEWFINLKEEWKKEEEKHLEYLKEQEIEKITVEGIRSIVLDKKKEAWKKWIEKQRERSNEYKKQDWFKKILDEYEKEGIHKNIKEERTEYKSVKKREKQKDNKINKYETKKILTQKMLIDIHMMLLEECKKEELEKEKNEFFKTNIEELGIREYLDEVNILEKIEEERSWNSILEKKKDEMEKWKREKWFIELMLEWKNNEQKYVEELNKKMLEKKDEEITTNIALERQKIIWKKHWDDIRKKWIENDNREEWFTKLVDEVESKENEYRSEITKKNIEMKKENEKNREKGESIIEINRKVKEVKKYEKTHLEDTDERINSIMMKKKLMWKTIVEIHMIVLEECKKEEWMLNRGKFLEACLEEFKKEEKEKYTKKIENDLELMGEEEENISTIMLEKQKLLWNKWVERNKSMLEKWKREEWFINLKKEWENEQKSYGETINESEIIEINVGENPMLEKQKKIWKQWLKKQRKWFIEHSKDKWFNDLLDEYENEEEYKNELTKRNVKKKNKFHKNIEKSEQDINYGVEKARKRKKLIHKVLIEIHMKVLEECKKEELEKEKNEFFKTNIEELGIREHLDEVNILEKIEEERSWNSILEKKKDEMEKWKREKWFIELMLEWKNNEQKYVEELNKKMLEKKDEEITTNIALERQKIIWKKHWDDIHKKWIENDNKEEWLTNLVDEIESKENEYKSEITKRSIEKKKENGEDREKFDSIIEINNKRKEKVRKYEEIHLDDADKKINSIIMKKKLKWKTMIEIHMIVLEECKKEEWMLNRGKFLETCLDEFKKEEKEKYTKKIENDLELMGEEEENISTIMLEKQKLLWNKWVERNKSMLEKWKREEWFINLKKEWENEQNNYGETMKESEIIEINVGGNPMLEKQKKIWKQWLKKQRIWFIEHSKDKWFNDLLDEYENEEKYKNELTKRNVKKINKFHKNIEKSEQDINNGVEKARKRKKLIHKVLIEIHMKVLEECKQEEWKKEKEDFFKTIMKELRIRDNLDEEVNLLEKIEEERSWNSILEKKKDEIEKWKREKWFMELMLEMKNNENKYMEEINEEILVKHNKGGIENPMLERQKIIWKKHWENILKKWIEKDNYE
ncbi:surface-associated interspersed protein (SURFIN) [Plasmodium gallinaceum]|uniref:Surface-associated interspersed protein (SURFIN) n=1 Tax=Plasmodium gallinaceum TaxID=5849 RepID=A0A1J1GPP5_PLAGA|nr:surface-associated interspersed protein (SURFIN) [Plasmodium gallinaceum]CRG94410.1 surface-associated interspersed protein (SURFIN) [Plasmodium gallinaceum]